MPCYRRLSRILSSSKSPSSLTLCTHLLSLQHVMSAWSGMSACWQGFTSTPSGQQCCSGNLVHKCMLASFSGQGQANCLSYASDMYLSAPTWLGGCQCCGSIGIRHSLSLRWQLRKAIKKSCKVFWQSGKEQPGLPEDFAAHLDCLCLLHASLNSITHGALPQWKDCPVCA